MKYKGYEFPQTPSKIEILSNTNVKKSPVFDGRSVVENVSVNPIIVKCSGEFFGKEGRECRDMLSYFLKQSEAGWLFAPELSPIMAFFTAFSYSKGADKNSISYSLEFTECCDSTRGLAVIDYTVCRAGENVFDIANRCSVGEDEIMRLNSFISPFDINEGDTVKIR